MPLAGGVPRRLTWSGEGAQVRGWTPDGEILVATNRASTLREPQLAIVSPATSALRMVALADARDGVVVDPATLVFTRYGLIGDNSAAIGAVSRPRCGATGCAGMPRRRR